MIMRIATFLTSLCLLASAQAQSPSLQLIDVLDASREHAPEILEQIERVSAAQGRVLESRGAFDLMFKSDGFDRVDGFWDGSVINNRLEQPLRPLGATIFSGYRLSDGNFPIYEDRNFTNDGGEGKVGIIFALLRDRAIDARRVGEFDADQAALIAELELWLTKIGVQQRAAISYWRWVIAGNQLEIYRELLRLAEERQVGLERQAETGQVADIFLVENMQNLTRRQNLVIRAQQELQSTANALAFFYRDTQGEPIIPAVDTLPAISAPQTLEAVPDSTETIEEMLANRPELSILQNEIQRASKQLELSENQLLPSLDLSMEVSRDFGDVAEGGISRDDTDTVLGFTFSQPIQNRAARGRFNQSRAELKALEYRQRRTEDQLEIAMRDIIIALEAATELVEIAQQEVEQADIMARAERRRFEGGESDLFVLNQREETATDARIRLLASQMDLYVATMNYYAAALQLQPLGLEEMVL